MTLVVQSQSSMSLLWLRKRKRQQATKPTVKALDKPYIHHVQSYFCMSYKALDQYPTPITHTERERRISSFNQQTTQKEKNNNIHIVAHLILLAHPHLHLHQACQKNLQVKVTTNLMYMTTIAMITTSTKLKSHHHLFQHSQIPYQKQCSIQLMHTI